jgi:Fic family protein
MTLREAITDKKNRLDRMRPLPPEALSKLEHYDDLEITYMSNAIEGNTLSPLETRLVIEQGVTISGRPSRITRKPSITTTRSATCANSLVNRRL